MHYQQSQPTPNQPTNRRPNSQPTNQPTPNQLPTNSQPTNQPTNQFRANQPPQTLMNGQNTRNLLNPRLVISLGSGLVGWLVACVLIGLIVDMKARDQRIALGAGGMITAVVFTVLSVKEKEPVAEERIVRMEMPKLELAPAPSTQPFDLPLGNGGFYYIEAVAGKPEANPESLVSSFRQAAPAQQVEEPYEDDDEDPQYPSEATDDYVDVWTDPSNWKDEMSGLPDIGAGGYPNGYRR